MNIVTSEAYFRQRVVRWTIVNKIDTKKRSKDKKDYLNGMVFETKNAFSFSLGER